MKTENNKSGFSLVELLVSMAILAVLILSAIVILKPQSLVGKATDTQRKSDLSKMKRAFEEYFNDKGYYPSNGDLMDWNVAANCGKKIDGLSKYLNRWLCDPNGQPYLIITSDNWFKIVTNLDNKEDKDIPDGWYSGGNYTTAFVRTDVNYGVSSTNVLWYEGDDVSAICGSLCLKFNSAGCNDTVGVGCSSPDFCFLGTCSVASCRVSSCN